jgi:hypothetical protein
MVAASDHCNLVPRSGSEEPSCPKIKHLFHTAKTPILMCHRQLIYDVCFKSSTFAHEFGSAGRMNQKHCDNETRKHGNSCPGTSGCRCGYFGHEFLGSRSILMEALSGTKLFGRFSKSVPETQWDKSSTSSPTTIIVSCLRFDRRGSWSRRSHS